jgi:hypothetical protein
VQNGRIWEGSNLTGEFFPKHEIKNKNFKNKLILDVSNM